MTKTNILTLVKVVNTLEAAGRPLKQAIKDVIIAYGLSRQETLTLIKLVQ